MAATPPAVSVAVDDAMTVQRLTCRTTPFARNVLWNLIGHALPLFVAVVAVPSLIHGLGASRFGMLSLAWVIVGYFTLFDLGLGRALTHRIARRIGTNGEQEVPALVWSAMAMMLLAGVVVGGATAATAPWIVDSKLQLEPELRQETLTAFLLLAVSIPAVMITTALRAILEARQRFDVVNIIRAPLGALNYLGPWALLPYTNALQAHVATLVLVRLVLCLTYLGACARLYPALRHPAVTDCRMARELLSFGGWITLSNLAAPLLLYLSRVWLAMFVSAAAVAHFSTPYDIVINLVLVPSVFAGVLFPTFARQFARCSGVGAASRLYERSLRQLFGIMLPVAGLTYWAAEPAIAWWIDPQFARLSYRVAQWMAIGVFVNSFGHVSQALVQAYGRPDLTAKLHVVELVVYVPYMAWLIEINGIEGAAMAWVVRVAISTLVLQWMARRCILGAIRVPCT